MALRKSIHELKQASKQIACEISTMQESIGRRVLPFTPLSSVLERLNHINSRLMYAERQLLDPTGIPGREWYKHVVYAPGLWAGYGASAFPSLREAIDRAILDDRHWPAVVQAELNIAEKISNMAHFIASKNEKKSVI
jgi:N-acetylated-alpha-linked acidic dipeptidase